MGNGANVWNFTFETVMFKRLRLRTAIVVQTRFISYIILYSGADYARIFTFSIETHEKYSPVSSGENKGGKKSKKR